MPNIFVFLLIMFYYEIMIYLQDYNLSKLLQIQNMFLEDPIQTSFIKQQNQTIQNIMVRQHFGEKFNRLFWKEISKLSPNAFLQQQQNIFTSLCRDKKAFDCIFSIFYNNHKTSEKHSKIRQYIYKDLIQKTLHQHFNQVKDKQHINKNSSLKFSIDTKPNENLKQQQSKKILNVNTPYKKIQQLGQKQISLATLRKNNQDFHDLFLRTFNACDGQRYIFYNYEKHMKGLYQKSKYNNFIRYKHSSNESVKVQKQNWPLIRRSQSKKFQASNYEICSFGQPVLRKKWKNLVNGNIKPLKSLKKFQNKFIIRNHKIIKNTSIH